jgi:dTDP-4-dehydrorhamnose reductase
MFQVLKSEFPGTRCTVRGKRGEWLATRLGMGTVDDIIEGVDATNIDELESVLVSLKPDTVVNCVGTIKQRPGGTDPVESIAINSLLPHRVSRTLDQWNGRLIHFSTDCVFSGARGNYTETDPSDATDLYGRTKLLGEVSTGRALTLRTSIIGRELTHHTGLLDWLLARAGKSVRGFTRAWWSGVTTQHLSHVVADIVRDHRTLTGLYHLSSGRISKYELLLLLRAAYSLNVQLEPDEGVFCDRSLRGDLFAERTGYVFPGWDCLLTDLVRDPTDYDRMKDA